MIVATLRRYSDSPGPIAEVIEQVSISYSKASAWMLIDAFYRVDRQEQIDARKVCRIGRCNAGEPSREQRTIGHRKVALDLCGATLI